MTIATGAGRGRTSLCLIASAGLYSLATDESGRNALWCGIYRVWQWILNSSPFSMVPAFVITVVRPSWRFQSTLRVSVGQREGSNRHLLTGRDRGVVELHIAATAGPADRALEVARGAGRVVDPEVRRGTGGVRRRVFPRA